MMPSLNILVAEDNEADVFLIRQALATHNINHTMYVAKDGEQAIAFIANAGTPSGPPYPDILLLDLNLPKADGHQVLQEFRSHPKVAKTPVIVVSSSGAKSDRDRMSSLGITEYFRKPMDFDKFMELGAVVKQAVGQ